MNFNEKLSDELTGLVVLSLESGLNEESKQRLEELLEREPLARKHYFRLINIHLGLLDPKNLKVLHGQNQNIPNDIELWKALANNEKKRDSRRGAQSVTDSNTSLKGIELGELNLDAVPEKSEESGLTQAMLEMLELERTSPAVEIPKEEPKRELIQKVESDFKWFQDRPGKRKVLLAMAASILLTIGFLHFFGTNNVDHPVVAKLTDSMKAAWDDNLESPDEYGNMIQSRYALNEGYARIVFNDGAKITVESPAELSLNSAGDMELFRGKIYAIVPQKANGFAVKTVNGKIVDLGTEFGIEVDERGDTQLHVTKGSTMLFAGLQSGKKEQITVNAGLAMKIYSDGFVKEIPAANKKFVRRICSKSGLVLRDIKLSLADLVGGGNGFGTGSQKQTIDPLTGKVTSEYVLEVRQGSSRFSPVKDLTYIDGVFVPDGGNGPVKVSTEGHLFENCIDTSGGCFRNISNYFQKHEDDIEDPIRGVMNGVLYGTTEKPAISMHSNTGITFNLDRIRQNIPNMRIKAFTSMCGVAGNEDRLQNYKSTFYVLVDGKKKFEISGLNKELLDIPVSITLTDQDRFLTLIAADGGDATAIDWCMFAMPTLELAESD